MASLTAAARRAAAVAAAAEQGLLGAGVMNAAASAEDKPMAIFFDADAWEENLGRARAAFGEHFLHACAVKTNPLSYFLRHAKELGHGAECASLGEVLHALSCGFQPRDIVYDSPCKTFAEIRMALQEGVHLNIDNLQELERVSAIVRSDDFELSEGAPIGIRVNPLVGAGTIAAFSVSTGKSKFGVPLPKSGAERNIVLDAVVACPWINCVHVHTGSGGMGLDQLVSGIRTAVDFALEVNSAAGESRITTIDMGGGLAVDFRAESPFSPFEEYAAALREAVPEVFDPSVFSRVVTEFGAALQCKFAFLASRVEYTKEYDGGRIALIHAGSDIFMRACYCPETFVHHRVFTFDASGQPKEVDEEQRVPHDIAGPLCFAGDVVVRDALVAPLEVDDIVVLADTGGNSLSIRTSHCSRQGPAVYAFRLAEDEAVAFETVRKTESLEAPLAQWAS